MKDRIALACRQLRLGRTIPETCDKISADSHLEYLARLLELEVAHRETARRSRLLNQAGFHGVKTFADYDFAEVKLSPGLTVDDLKTASFLADKRNLICYGNVGTGKTHLATAIGVEVCNQGKTVRFHQTASLVNQLVEAKKRGELGRFLRQFAKLDLLICDEWGYVPLDREGSQLLFQVIAECYEQRSVILTTNLEFSKWVNIFYDEQMTAAMIDRLVHHSHLLVFDGQSHRMRYSLMRTS